MVLGEVFRPKPGPQEAPRGPKTAKTKQCKIQEIRFSECQWAAQIIIITITIIKILIINISIIASTREAPQDLTCRGVRNTALTLDMVDVCLTHWR